MLNRKEMQEYKKNKMKLLETGDSKKRFGAESDKVARPAMQEFIEN